MPSQEIALKVAEAIQDDVNKGILRLDSNFMREIDVRPGDIIEVEGDRMTVGIVDRAYPGDIGLNIIRMDGITRRNAKTGISEMVKVRKAQVKEAKKIVIAPASKGIMIQASPNVFKQGLLGRALVKGDIVSLGGTRKRRNTMSQSPFFNDIFNMLDESMVGVGFGDIKFIVINSSPGDAVVISELTEVEFNPEAVEISEEKVLEVTYEDIGGLEEEIHKIREMVELPLKHPEIFERLGIEAPKGVLLHGPPGTGKTLLAKAVANETNSHFILINGPEIMSKYYGQSEENLRNKFEEAEKNAPSIIFIDEVDAIAAKREEVHGEVERRVVAQLLALMDGLKNRGKVVVIAASNIPNALDPALRRPGRFDREIEIGVPSKIGRFKIMKIHTRNMPLEPTYEAGVVRTVLDEREKEGKDKGSEIAKIRQRLTTFKTNSNLRYFLRGISKQTWEQVKGPDDNVATKKGITAAVDKIKDASLKKFLKKLNDVAKDDKEVTQILTNAWFGSDLRNEILDRQNETTIKEIADITHGFVGADLSALCKEAAMIVLRRILPDLKMSEDKAIPVEILERLKVTYADFRDALKVVRPSAMREVLIEIPDVKWEQIGGLDVVKQELKEAVEWPLKHPEAFTRLGVSPPKGILMYGPPGTGKTLMAKAVATQSQANFIVVKGPELISKWVGESEKAIRKVFDKARQTSPSIVFFDEIDSIAPRRGISSDDRVSERVVNQLLTEMDGLDTMHDIVIIAATNRPDMMDTALLRPGRFDRIILTPVPDAKAREDIFNIHTKSMPLESVDLKKLSEKTEGYVGADIESIAREAAIYALREDMSAKVVKLSHFEQALEKVRPSVTKDVVKAYEDLKDGFRAARGKEMQEEKPGYFG
ncbi:MAG: CDC48 family AAA ATPase [archaeon]